MLELFTMRILTIHADYIEVEARQKAIKDAEAIELPYKKKFDEVLVVFTSVEEGDTDVVAVAAALEKSVSGVCDQVKTKNVLLYPLVHLTSKPSKPAVAKEVLAKAEELLKAKGYFVDHSPFGWYKGYTLKCKGHPLSELSRELKGETGAGCCGEPEKNEVVSASLKQESAMKSRFMILDMDGNLHELDKFNYAKWPELEKFANYEHKKQRVYDHEPPHIKIMKEHSLIDYEPGSDPGNFRFLPKGRLVKKLLEKAITDYCVDYGAMEVETPIMYDYEHPSLKKYLNRFPARQYVVTSDEKKLFLRFAACFGQFLIAHDTVMSYKQLPLKMFELTRYSFRREQGGELAGLKRLRAFTMPDMHTFCGDMEQAKKEFESQFDLGREWMQGLDLESEAGFRIQEDFFNENKTWYVSMVKRWGKPILLELFKERYAYFITKFEFNFVDSMNKASALTTVQIDVENADTYDINYVSEDNTKKRPLILHASISGSLERVIYALLEREANRIKQGKKGLLPLWLAPIQIRLIPVSEKQRDHCEKLLAKVGDARVRMDLDDRNELLGKKIRDAERDWVPYFAVIGDKELESGKLSVSIRATGEKKEMTFEELVALGEKDNANKPFEKLSLPAYLSKRPII
jgi:threonyl-tRNA synthetase